MGEFDFYYKLAGWIIAGVALVIIALAFGLGTLVTSSIDPSFYWFYG